MKQAGMNQDTRESLSAGIDGELSREQLRFLLRRLDHDASLQQAWTRYHIARDSLHQQLPPLAGAGFAARVMLAIEQESSPAATSPQRSHWLRWSTGGAIAASVAAAALMIGQPTGDAERLTASTARQASAVAAAPANKPVAPAAVPPWLSGNSAGLLSQQASATFGTPFGQSQSAYARRLSGYPSMPRYRTLDNNDGSYLLLLEPEQPVAPDTSRRASAVAQ
ncbi:sigma-E factor negative regulatory protein [Rhodanobacter denitrificans]|uniref:sigma-E factor negative regulatory protein n=1 Tax=Rhodanobacter TaxID=75309 RepID=UPI000260DD9D|nr:sigma-E factor negative regulatory protein [Rhodanobacter denitrificans]EIM01973.1 negative regulator of sigma E activity [Rhodanobacter denitrificans]